MNKNWNAVYMAPDAEQAYNIFHRTLQATLDIACPTKNEIPDKEDMVVKKKNYDKKLREIRKNANADFINSADNKSKALWNVINNERRGKHQLQPNICLSVNGKHVDNPTQTADHFNTFFTEVAELTLKQNNCSPGDADDNENYETPLNYVDKSLYLTPTCINEVRNIINALKSKSTEDGFHVKFARHIEGSKFKWPPREDIATIDESQIEIMLKPPRTITKNDRVTSFSFKIGFGGLSIE
ncbi:hypothetical protein J6590_100994 [Homalodisca vitripennis]|nr:hypothetical protein J6590_100994 [Homalodisca vitripennis]